MFGLINGKNKCLTLSYIVVSFHFSFYIFVYFHNVRFISSIFIYLFVFLGLWHINHCWLFNAKSFLYKSSSISSTFFSISTKFSSIWPISSTLVEVGVLPFCRDAVGVFYNHSRLVNSQTHKNTHTHTHTHIYNDTYKIQTMVSKAYLCLRVIKHFKNDWNVLKKGTLCFDHVSSENYNRDALVYTWEIKILVSDRKMQGRRQEIWKKITLILQDFIIEGVLF